MEIPTGFSPACDERNRDISTATRCAPEMRDRYTVKTALPRSRSWRLISTSSFPQNPRFAQSSSSSHLSEMSFYNFAIDDDFVGPVSIGGNFENGPVGGFPCRVFPSLAHS
jgi:predicted DNA-binding transcriptional regulator AlpA